MRIVPEAEFAARVKEYDAGWAGWVTGPGRSGAMAAVYVSHHLGVPFIPYGQKAPAGLGRGLVVDTARLTGKTMRKALRKYPSAAEHVFYEEGAALDGRVAFWYEAEKPQRYKHEGKSCSTS